MEGIFRTNNFALGPLTSETAHGVFLRISRLNHACSPNCEVVWKDESQCQEVVAIRDIENGDELTICYLNIENRMKTAEERKKILRPYGFCCSCRDCAGEEDVQKIRRFQEMNKILKGKDETDEIVQLCLEKENILQVVGGKLVWRISTLEIAVALCSEKDISEILGKQIKYLRNMLYG